MVHSAPVLVFPNPQLRMVSYDVSVLDGPSLPQLIDILIATLEDSKGAGISGPQIKVFKRVVVINRAITGTMEHVVLYNPEIESTSALQLTKQEGCLSFPGVFLDISRPISLTVKAFSPQWEPLVIEASSDYAQALQHELDHLDGKLIIDYASRQVRRQIERTFTGTPLQAWWKDGIPGTYDNDKTQVISNTTKENEK